LTNVITVIDLSSNCGLNLMEAAFLLATLNTVVNVML